MHIGASVLSLRCSDKDQKEVLLCSLASRINALIPDSRHLHVVWVGAQSWISFAVDRSTRENNCPPQSSPPPLCHDCASFGLTSVDRHFDSLHSHLTRWTLTFAGDRTTEVRNIAALRIARAVDAFVQATVCAGSDWSL